MQYRPEQPHHYCVTSIATKVQLQALSTSGWCDRHVCTADARHMSPDRKPGQKKQLQSNKRVCRLLQWPPVKSQQEHGRTEGVRECMRLAWVAQSRPRIKRCCTKFSRCRCLKQ
jgi:hypothetical protein